MSPADVRARADAAAKFDDVARLVDGEDGGYRKVTAALAVLAGIAAADAMSGSVLGHCSRGQDHRQAVDLLRSVRGASDAAAALGRLLDLKDSSHYGPDATSADAVTKALNASKTMLDRMHEVLARP
jgi:hypothetical protein